MPSSAQREVVGPPHAVLSISRILGAVGPHVVSKRHVPGSIFGGELIPKCGDRLVFHAEPVCHALRRRAGAGEQQNPVCVSPSGTRRPCILFGEQLCEKASIVR